MKKTLTRLAIAAMVTTGVLQSPGSLYAFSGREGASFLDIPAGGRPAALGTAYSAEASDAYAPLYNPAGLGHLRTAELAGMHVSYLQSINYEYATFAYPLSVGNSLGASIQYLSPGTITSRDGSGNVTGDFVGHYAAYSLAYGRHIGDYLALGVTAKMIEGVIASESARAYGADIGAMLRPDAHWSFALVASNLGSSLTFIDQKDPLPRAYHAGVRYAPSRRWALMGEEVYQQAGLASAHGGIEWNPVEYFSLRTGYRTDTTRELSALAGLTTGFGVHAFGQEFDYAWLPLGDLGSTHYFSIVLRFTHADREHRNIVHVPGKDSTAELEKDYYEPPLPSLEPMPVNAQSPNGEAMPTERTQ